MGSTVPVIRKSAEVGDFSWPGWHSDGQQQALVPVDVHRMTRG